MEIHSLFTLIVGVLSGIVYGQTKIHACKSKIYCHGPLLEAIQTAGIFPDSKTFVDMSMKNTEAVILADFEQLENRTSDNLSLFVKKHFSGPGEELEDWSPPDWDIQCVNVERQVADLELKAWTRDINSLWPMLGRKIKSSVKSSLDRRSLLYVPNPFILPGGRFREFYYWDTYWIIRGLLLCDMSTTAKAIIENLLYHVENLGHVPNGGRVYYEGRSQPPFLTQMVHEYYQATGDVQFIKDYIHLLVKEYDFWIRNRTVDVVHPTTGTAYSMARYAVRTNTPRPEGFIEDIRQAEKLPSDKQGQLYSELASGAESGWDFSSRWLGDNRGLEDIQTSKVIPVDLNSFLCLNEQLLSQYHALLNNTDLSSFYQKKARYREAAMLELMWNDTTGAWFDLHLDTVTQNPHFYPSNLSPMFAGCYGNIDGMDKSHFAQKAINYLKNEKILDYEGGVPTSKMNTGFQWDWDNSWPPVVHMLIAGLVNSGHTEAREIAEKLAQTWIYNNWKTYKLTGAMYEKYDASKVGLAGGGGEYEVQVGFGWTNGVALILLHQYGDRLTSQKTQTSRKTEHNVTSTSYLAVVVVVVIAVGFVVLIVMLIRNHRRKVDKRKAAKRDSKFQNVAYSKVNTPQPRTVRY